MILLLFIYIAAFFACWLVARLTVLLKCMQHFNNCLHPSVQDNQTYSLWTKYKSDFSETTFSMWALFFSLMEINKVREGKEERGKISYLEIVPMINICVTNIQPSYLIPSIECLWKTCLSFIETCARQFEMKQFPVPMQKKWKWEKASWIKTSKCSWLCKKIKFIGDVTLEYWQYC